MVQQTHNMEVTAKLGGVICEHHRETDSIALIRTPSDVSNQQYLLQIKFTQVNNSVVLFTFFLYLGVSLQVDKKSPEFHSRYGSCEQRLDLEFTTLNANLHKESLQALIKFGNDLNAQMQETLQAPAANASFPKVVSSISDSRIRRLSAVKESLTSGKSNSGGTKRAQLCCFCESTHVHF